MGFFDWLMKGIGFESEDDGYDVSKIERQQRKEQKRLEKEAKKKEAKNKTTPKTLEFTAGTNGYTNKSNNNVQTSFGGNNFSDSGNSFNQTTYSSGGYGSSQQYDMMNGSVGGYGSKNVVFYYPKSYEEVQQLIDYLKQGESVMLNLDSVTGGDAQRMLDFASGAVYALGGCIQQVATNIFLLTPEGLGIVDSRNGNR